MIISPKHSTNQHPILGLNLLNATNDLKVFTSTDISNFIDETDSLALYLTNVVAGTKLTVQIELLRVLPPRP